MVRSQPSSDGRHGQGIQGIPAGELVELVLHSCLAVKLQIVPDTLGLGDSSLRERREEMTRKPLLPPQKKRGKKGKRVQTIARPRPLNPQVKRGQAVLCGMLKLIHDVNDKEAGQHYEAGDDKAGDESSNIAAEAKKDGKKWGCSWA
jgi:hypothetical protein